MVTFDQPLEKIKSRQGRKTPTIQKHPRILIAEDDDEMRSLLASRLRHEAYEVTECVDGIQLLDRLGSFVLSAEPGDFDMLISDIRMPGVTGLEVLEGMRECKWFIPVILITAFGDEKTHALAQQLGAAAILDKPFEIDDLIRKVREVLAHDKPWGTNWSPSVLRDMQGARFPLDVMFGHFPPSDEIESFIRETAIELNGLRDRIHYCRVVVDGPHRPPKENTYHIHLLVTIPGKSIIVHSNAGGNRIQRDLHTAIHEAFVAASGKIRTYLEKEDDEQMLRDAGAV